MHPVKYRNGLLVGLMFTIISLILTFTFVVPMMSMLLGMVFEILAREIVSMRPYNNVARTTTLLLAVLLVIILALILLHVRKAALRRNNISKVRVAGFMMIIYFIIHPLVFYIYWGVAFNYHSDGQLIFSAVNSFPFSSIAFSLFGFMIDITANYAARNNEKMY